MGMNRIIDGDGHIMEEDGISRFLPSPFRDIGPLPLARLFPPLDHLHAGQAPSRTPPGSFRRVQADGWLQFLDDVGIEQTVLYPTTGLAYGKINNADWAIAVTRAYNDWLAENYLQKSRRFQGMALIPLQEPEAAAAELRRAVTELGMCGAMLPSTGLPLPLGAKTYWPIYSEANRLGCALAIHGGCHNALGFDHLNVHAPVHALGHPFGITIAFASIVFNGIFDEFPKVRIAFLEGGVAWLLVALERFDRSYETHIYYNPRGQLLKLDPGEKVSEYIVKQVKAGRLFVGCEGNEPALAFAVKVVGCEPFVYSSDFPHEVNNQTCKKELLELMEADALTSADKEAILHGNAERLYAFQP